MRDTLQERQKGEIWAILPDGCSQSLPEPQKGIGGQQGLLLAAVGSGSPEGAT